MRAANIPSNTAERRSCLITALLLQVVCTVHHHHASYLGWKLDAALPASRGRSSAQGPGQPSRCSHAIVLVILKLPRCLPALAESCGFRRVRCTDYTAVGYDVTATVAGWPLGCEASWAEVLKGGGGL